MTNTDFDVLYPNLPPERHKYKSNDVPATCPICGAGFWQRAYPVNGKLSPETCGTSCGQHKRAREAGVGVTVLTPREKEVWDLVQQGYSLTAVAQRLGISSGTAKNHARIARLKVAAGSGGF